ncbi:MAG: hypothetical protein JXQ75_19590 [Phycisphaerae bacterium]|nr:hypothetical protein [Phycisphaerae bacterium]
MSKQIKTGVGDVLAEVEKRDPKIAALIKRLIDLPGPVLEFPRLQLEHAVGFAELDARRGVARREGQRLAAAEKAERERRLAPARERLAQAIEELRAVDQYEIIPAHIRALADAAREAEVSLDDALRQAGLDNRHYAVQAFRDLAEQQNPATAYQG